MLSTSNKMVPTTSPKMATNYATEPMLRQSPTMAAGQTRPNATMGLPTISEAVGDTPDPDFHHLAASSGNSRRITARQHFFQQPQQLNPMRIQSRHYSNHQNDRHYSNPQNDSSEVDFRMNERSDPRLMRSQELKTWCSRYAPEITDPESVRNMPMGELVS
jgi:hypothetical protein